MTQHFNNSKWSHILRNLFIFPSQIHYFPLSIDRSNMMNFHNSFSVVLTSTSLQLFSKWNDRNGRGKKYVSGGSQNPIKTREKHQEFHIQYQNQKSKGTKISKTKEQWRRDYYTYNQLSIHQSSPVYSTLICLSGHSWFHEEEQKFPP